MQKYILAGLCNIASAFGIAFCGKAALETNYIGLCLIYWIGVYFILELHVYLINYLKNLN